MHRDIKPVELAFSAPDDHNLVPVRDFTRCFDLKQFSLAPIYLIIGIASGVGAYMAYCDGESEAMYEFEVIDWLEDRGMSRQSALDLLLAANARNGNRIV